MGEWTLLCMYSVVVWAIGYSMGCNKVWKDLKSIIETYKGVIAKQGEAMDTLANDIKQLNKEQSSE